MASIHGLCPTCGVIDAWRFNGVSVSLPPTGGDYTWAETDATAHCPACGASIPVRVRVDLDDQQIEHLVHSPLPTLPDRRWYVVARVRNHAADLVSVTIQAFATTEAAALRDLEAVGGAYKGYEQRCVLEVSAAGYRRLDGTPLHASANRVISYE